MRRVIESLVVLVVGLSTSVIWAHEGHGHDPSQGNTPIHYLTEPIHLLQLLVMAAVAGTIARILHNRLKRHSSFRPFLKALGR